MANFGNGSKKAIIKIKRQSPQQAMFVCPPKVRPNHPTLGGHSNLAGEDVVFYL